MCAQGDGADSVVEAGLTYMRVAVRATDPTTDIWIGDDHGHLVMKATGALDTHLLTGSYSLEFGLGSATYPLELQGPVDLTEENVRAGPPRDRPPFRFYE